MILERESLFENLKLCPICNITLPENYEDELCPMCQENQLFNEVKEYIRSKDVNEYQVAEHFDIPRSKVKKWIKEGRIEYKEKEQRLVSVHCSKCGEPIAFGNLCQKCYREQFQAKSGYALGNDSSDDSRMRFLEDDSSVRSRTKKKSK